MKHFRLSIIFTLFAVLAAFGIGFLQGGAAVGGSYALLALILGVLETSLSFDNAVVNAKVLGDMSEGWRQAFLTIGMIIAVFGMRFLFPIVIVWAVGSSGLLDTIQLVWQNPKQFQIILSNQHVLVDGFGGAFLFLVFASYFFDTEKEVNWIPGLEKLLNVVAKVQDVWLAFTLGMLWLFRSIIAQSNVVDANSFFYAGISGVLTYLLVKGLGSVLESTTDSDTAGAATNAVVKAGLGTFIYLEILDASFSFDGVIGAFAVTNNLFIIALGLGIGSFFVRSLTVLLVESGTLAEYKYLENGAFWAIGALATIMFLQASEVHVPEVVSGLIGAGFIGAALVSSIFASKNKPISE